MEERAPAPVPILPGSSIAWVHREAEQTYEEVRKRLEILIGDAASACGRGEGRPRVLNSAPMTRAEAVVVRPEQAGDLQPAQVLADGRYVAWTVTQPAAAAVLEPGPPAGLAPVTVRGTTLDNGLLRVHIDGDGLLASVYDVEADREVLAPGERGNLLQLHPDLPSNWDAWDIERHYLNTRVDLVRADSVAILDEGPLMARAEVRRTFGASRVTQTYTLAAGSKRVDVDTEVDWRESEKVLKAAFPIDVRAEWSSAEIQFGHVKRPTHTNTSWDQARFEVCGHRWVHVGEVGYGAAVATRRPGRLDAGYALNLPLRVVGAFEPEWPVVAVDNPSIRVEAVKLAEDRSGDLVVRLYESEGRRARGTVRLGFDCVSASTTDLLERPVSEEVLVGSALTLTLRLFEIRTLRLVRGATRPPGGILPEPP